MWESTSHLQPECKRRDKRLQGEFSFQFRDYCRPPSLPEASPAIHTQQSHLPVFTVTYSLPRLGEGHSDILVVQSGMTTLCWGRLLRHKEQITDENIEKHQAFFVPFVLLLLLLQSNSLFTDVCQPSSNT
ncbi:uncharacterized protein LOC125626378 isoform X2 [Caretta caretta]|uniref:uncharacterized protein LOC125626378 isoform X2 n=1 Tax=Caretta caretta TaxID=8467 RepID=UPI0020961569|nr:uncharacterized protein LOC125626378 isoform X3 [Caretta caretta]